MGNLRQLQSLLLVEDRHESSICGCVSTIGKAVLCILAPTRQPYVDVNCRAPLAVSKVSLVIIYEAQNVLIILFREDILKNE